VRYLLQKTQNFARLSSCHYCADCTENLKTSMQYSSEA